MLTEKCHLCHHFFLLFILSCTSATHSVLHPSVCRLGSVIFLLYQCNSNKCSGVETSWTGWTNNVLYCKRALLQRQVIFITTTTCNIIIYNINIIIIWDYLIYYNSHNKKKSFYICGCSANRADEWRLQRGEMWTGRTVYSLYMMIMGWVLKGGRRNGWMVYKRTEEQMSGGHVEKTGREGGLKKRRNKSRWKEWMRVLLFSFFFLQTGL